MLIKTTLNYSPNFNPIKRDPSKIKFLIFHYTGMKKESDAINKLKDIQSEVSSHYLIKNNGEIITLVPDLYVAWHAGKSSWKNYNNLNKYSIGIEICNPGHQFHYKKFSRHQIKSLIKLTKYLSKKYKINYKNLLGHSDISPNRKKDPGEKFPWEYLAQNKIGYWHNLDKKILRKFRKNKIKKKEEQLFLKNLFKIGYSKKKINNQNNIQKNIYIIKAFQRRFRQELVNGKIDEECFLISKKLAKSTIKLLEH
tara:strand:+ start:1998 stop:2756 length:759 start_codon:yes stop_codon:yes gene_type:complete